MGISDEYTLFGIIANTLKAKHSDHILLSSKDFDDCAMIKMDETYSLVVTSDFVRGSGFYLFELGYLNYFDVGYYLIGANLSDIAAMGATPIGINTVIRYSKSMNDNDFKEVFEGMNEICALYNVSIIGGDIGSYSCDVFSATALGKVETNKALRRGSVNEGDILCLTGKIGDAISCLTYLKDIKPENPFLSIQEEETILRSWKQVKPRLEAGQLLSKHFDRVACQDISDGLKATIYQMSQLSQKTFTIYEDKIPISEETKKIAKGVDTDPMHLAFSASVDFELLISIPEMDLNRAIRLLSDNGHELFPIGEVNGLSENKLVRTNGNLSSIPGIEWKQQATDFIKEITS